MNDQTGKRSFYRAHKKVIAMLLVTVMLGTTVFTALGLSSRITINREVDRGNPAAHNLASNTEYVNKSITGRVMDRVSLLGSKETLSDFYTLAGTQIAREQYGDALVSIIKCIELYDARRVSDEEMALYLDLWLKRACLEVMLEKHAQALLSLDEVLRIDDTVSDAHLVRAQAYAMLGDIPGMSESLQAYLILVPEDQEMRALLAEALLQQENYGGMAQYAAQETQRQEPSAELEYLSGLYAIQDGDYVEAEAALTRAIRLNPDYEGLFYFRGVCRLTLMDYTGAAEDFGETVARGYMVHSAHYNLGIARILSDQYEEGLADIEAAAEMEDDASTRAQALEFLGQVAEIETEAALMELLVKAQACSEQEDMAGLSEYLTEYLEEKPEDDDIREILAQALFAGEQYGKAMIQYQTLIDRQLTPAEGEPAGPEKLSEYYYLYGLSAIQTSEFETAERVLSGSIDLHDGHDGAYYYRGVCRLSLGAYETAIGDFDQSIGREEMIQSCIYNRGICRLMLEDYEAGIADVEAAAAMTEDAEVAEQAAALLAEIREVTR